MYHSVSTNRDAYQLSFMRISLYSDSCCDHLFAQSIIKLKLKSQVLCKRPKGDADFSLHFKWAFINTCLCFHSFQNKFS